MRNWRRECRFWAKCLWTNYLSTSAHQRRFSDFQLGKPMLLINLQWHLLILSHSFLINQQHPLQTHGQLRQVDHFVFRSSGHCLQFQNKFYVMLGILELVRGRTQPPVHKSRNLSKEDTAKLKTRARNFNCLLRQSFPENKQENNERETHFRNKRTPVKPIVKTGKGVIKPSIS